MAQSPFAAEALAHFLLCNLGLLLLLPGRAPAVLPAQPLCRQRRAHAPSTGAPLLASAGDFIGCLLTELEINVIILHSNWQHVW